jgi:Domain of unknown function (DUF1707)/Cell wall-active antibiotics response 4TMS YvqF
VTSRPAVRASDAEREQTVALLRRHAVDGRLTLEEFAQRMGIAYEAKTQEELQELTRDLPAESSAVPARRGRGRRWIVSFMGGADRRGRFRLGTHTAVVTVMGGANIDLRQAELEDPDVTITAVSVMGGTNIVVPEGVDVELTGFALMGGKGFRPGQQPPPPGAPLVRVRAFALMGGVSVVTKRRAR